MAAWLDWDAYVVELQQGRGSPLPDYVGEWRLAKWIGVTRAALEDMPIYEVETARIVMEAEARADRELQQRAKHRKA